MPCNFTYSHYAEICDLLKKKRYSFSTYFDHSTKSEPIVILRHDIDQSPAAAITMANLEKELGVISTYFFWIRSPFYNAFSTESSTIIKKIQSLGHSIGIHFDTKAYGEESEENLETSARNEADIFTRFFGIKPQAISFHRPPVSALGGEVMYAGLPNAYSKAYFKEFRYLSDSRMIWKEGCACQHISEKPSKLHMLIHPFWWTSTPMTFEKRTESFIEEKRNHIDDQLAKNISIYRRRFP